VSPQEYLQIRLGRSNGMDKSLKNGNSIFRPVSVLTQRGERQPMRGTVGQIESAFSRNAIVLSVGQTLSSRTYHSVELGPRSRLCLKLSYPDEIVEFRFAHN
jgi:hypothetical protein